MELIWLLFLNMLSFNFVPTLNKSHRFRRFWRSYVNRPAVVLIKAKLLFRLCTLFKTATYLFFTAVCLRKGQTAGKKRFFLVCHSKFRRKNSKIFPYWPFFLGFLIKYLSKCPNFTKSPLPWNILVGRLLSPMHLRNLFLLSTPVAGILLTPRWLSRRKNEK